MEIPWTTKAVEVKCVPSTATVEGLSTSSTLQWHINSASQAFTDFRRMTAEQIETFSNAPRVRAGS